MPTYSTKEIMRRLVLSGGLIETFAGVDLQLLPGAGGITRVGTGVPAYLAGPTSNDFYVGGRVEFASYNYLTGITYTRNRLVCCAGPDTILVQMGQYASSHVHATWVAQTTDGLHLCLSGAVGGAQRNLILTDALHYNKAHGHSALSPHPTLWPHSVRDVDDSNREWGQIVHEGDDFVRGCGKGGHRFTVDDQAARGSGTVVGAAVLNEAFVLGAITYTAKDAQNNAADEYLRTGTVTEIAAAMAEVICEGTGGALAKAWSAAGVLTTEWGVAGVVGNAVVWTEGLTNCTFDGGGTLGGTHKGIAAATRIHAPSDGDITMTPETGTVAIAGRIRTTISTANVSNPPTDAELDAEFGTPADVGEGFECWIDDNGAGTLFWKVATVGGFWVYSAVYNKAV